MGAGRIRRPALKVALLILVSIAALAVTAASTLSVVFVSQPDPAFGRPADVCATLPSTLVSNYLDGAPMSVRASGDGCVWTASTDGGEAAGGRGGRLEVRIRVAGTAFLPPRSADEVARHWFASARTAAGGADSVSGLGDEAFVAGGKNGSPLRAGVREGNRVVLLSLTDGDTGDGDRSWTALAVTLLANLPE